MKTLIAGWVLGVISVAVGLVYSSPLADFMYILVAEFGRYLPQ